MKVLKSTKEISHDEWLKQRMKGCGGSDAATIMGVNPWRSPFDLWMEKTGEFVQDASNEKMYWGTVLEDIVAREFTKRTGKKVRKRNAILQHPDHGWMIANVDRLVVGERAILECKTTSAFNQWDEVPEYYYAQVQHYLAVTAYHKAYLAVLVGGQEYRDFEIQRNDAYITELIEKESDFWRKVKNGEPPDLDGSESCTQMVSKLYPEGKDEEIDLPMDAFRIVENYEAAAQEEKDAKERKDAAANQLKDMLRTNERGRIYSRLVTWKTVTSRRLDTKTLEAEQPEIYERYVKESISRRFTVK